MHTIIFTNVGLIDRETGRAPVLSGVVEYRLSNDLWTSVYGNSRLARVDPTVIGTDLSLRAADFDPVAVGRKYGMADNALLTAGVIGISYLTMHNKPAEALVRLAMAANAAATKEQAVADALSFKRSNWIVRLKMRADTAVARAVQIVSDVRKHPIEATNAAVAWFNRPDPKEIPLVAPKVASVVGPPMEAGVSDVLHAIASIPNTTAHCITPCGDNIEVAFADPHGVRWNFVLDADDLRGRAEDVAARVASMYQRDLRSAIATRTEKYEVTARSRSSEVVLAGGMTWGTKAQTILADEATLRDLWQERGNLIITWGAGWTPPGATKSIGNSDARRLGAVMGDLTYGEVADLAGVPVGEVIRAHGGDVAVGSGMRALFDREVAPLNGKLLAWVINEEVARTRTGKEAEMAELEDGKARTVTRIPS